jgi:hypothetical protein
VAKTFLPAMTTDQIKVLQSRIGTTADGIWGPVSVRACRAHLTALMPSPSPWPKSDTASMREFYGDPGNERNLVSIRVAGLGLEYEGKPVTSIRCHRKCADSLLRILTELKGHPVLKKYAGCYNFRAMRGGTSWSKHAWGAAIDLAPDTNGLRMSWPVESDMPIEIMAAFARAGWVSAGAFWGRDSMHFESTS